MKTRTKTPAKADAAESTASVAPKVQLTEESTNPPHVFILPQNGNALDDGGPRIVSIENPRYGEESRYLLSPQCDLYEFTRVSAPKTTPRSWLLDPKEEGPFDGFVTKAADLYIATPIDPLFILLPALAPKPKLSGSEPAKLFLAGDDYFERMISTSPDLRSLARIESLRKKLETRMAVVCDTVDAGDEMMYRLNEEKLLQALLKKSRKMVKKGLPASMEEKLIRKALEVPMLSIERNSSSLSELVNEEDPLLADSGTATPAEAPDTQTTNSTVESTMNTLSEISTAATSISEDVQPLKIALPPINAPDGIEGLLRLQTALFFIFSAYLAPHLTTILKKILSSPSSPVDFDPLETHLAHLTKLRQEALAARTLGDYSRKRSMDEEFEGLETRAEKKRKKDEEEKKKKAGESRGVRDLKKVNVTGMKKMSDFFKKKA